MDSYSINFRDFYFLEMSKNSIQEKKYSHFKKKTLVQRNPDSV